MFCPNCGTQVQDGGRFCPTCGAPLGPQPTQQTQRRPQPQQYADPASYPAQQVPLEPTLRSAPLQQSGYGYVQQQGSPARRRHMQTNRSLVAYVLLTMLTCGLYAYYFIYSVAQDMNEMCQDDEETGGLLFFILLSVVTCGLYGLYWEYKLANRLQRNAPIYGLTFTENGTTVILWRLLGALICFVGSFYGTYIYINNLNRLADAYNRYFGV